MMCSLLMKMAGLVPQLVPLLDRAQRPHAGSALGGGRGPPAGGGPDPGPARGDL